MTKKLNLVAAGFTRRKDWDFTDDGSMFRAYEYKGLRITVHKYDGEYYVAISNEGDQDYTWEDYSKTNASNLENEFNGVTEVDVNKLISNCEELLKVYQELNNTARTESIDISSTVLKLGQEIKMAKEVVEEFKHNFKWYDASEYDLRRLTNYMKSEINQIEICESLYKKMVYGEMTNSELRRYHQNFSKYGYVVIEEKDFYLDEMRNALH